MRLSDGRLAAAFAAVASCRERSWKLLCPMGGMQWRAIRFTGPAEVLISVVMAGSFDDGLLG